MKKTELSDYMKTPPACYGTFGKDNTFKCNYCGVLNGCKLISWKAVTKDVAHER